MPEDGVELRVSCDCGERAVWSGSVRLSSNDALLDEGSSDSKVAAQIAARYALDRRLKKAGLKRLKRGPLKWKELLEAGSSIVVFGHYR